MSAAAEMLALLAKHEPGAIPKIGLTPAQVRAAAAKYQRVELPVLVESFEPRRALARDWRKNSHGGARIPSYVIEAMAKDYARLGSARKVGTLYPRDLSTILYILRSRGIPLKGRGGPNNRRKAA